MGLFGRKKPKITAQAARATETPAAPRERAEALEVTHPVFQLKIGMDKNAVIALLGGDYLSMSTSQLSGSRLFGGAQIADDGRQCWLYSGDPEGHSIQIVFRSGELEEAEMLKKNTDGGRTLLVRIDRKGLAAVEPYRAALGLKRL